MEAIKIIIADDQSCVRYGLRIFLEQQAGWRVIGEADEANSLLNQVLITCPEVVLLDWGLPGMFKADLIEALRASCPRLYVIIFSGQVDIQVAAMEAGGDAFISKSESPEQLLGAIRAAIRAVRPGRSG